MIKMNNLIEIAEERKEGTNKISEFSGTNEDL